MRYTENCNACSWHWSAERAKFSSKTTTNHISHKPSPWQHPTTHRTSLLQDNTQPHIAQARLQKLNKLCSKSFASSAISTWPPANQLPLLQTPWQLLARKMLPQPAGGRKCFPRVHRILSNEFLRYKNKQAYFSWAKNVLIVMVPIWMNKDVLEPSYNDLKFMAQNHDYVCIKLIGSHMPQSTAK